jgi:hypothetical protein
MLNLVTPRVQRTARMGLCRFLQFGLQINRPLLAFVRDALFFYTAVCHFNIFCLFFGKFPRLLSDNIIGCDMRARQRRLLCWNMQSINLLFALLLFQLYLVLLCRFVYNATHPKKTRISKRAPG